MACRTMDFALDPLPNGNYSDMDSSYDYDNYTYNDTYGSYFLREPSILQRIELILYRWVILGIVIFGIAGNMLNLTVLTSKSLSKSMGRMEMSAHIGLVALAISDLMFCVVVMPKSFDSLSTSFHQSLTFMLVYDVYGDAVINIFETMSTWLTVSMAFSRYMAICHPFKARMFVGKTFARINVLIVFLASIAFNLPRFFVFEIANLECDDGTFRYFKFVRKMRYYSGHAYTWCHFIIGIILPLVLMAFCNFFLIKEVRSAPHRIQRQTTREKKRDNSTYLLTLTLTLIVVLYIVLVSPAEFNNFVAHMVEIEEERVGNIYNFSVAVTSTLKTLNFAVNFVLYCTVNAHFRSVIREKLFCRGKKNFKRNASLQHTEYSRITGQTPLDRNATFISDRSLNTRNSCV